MTFPEAEESSVLGGPVQIGHCAWYRVVQDNAINSPIPAKSDGIVPLKCVEMSDLPTYASTPSPDGGRNGLHGGVEGVNAPVVNASYPPGLEPPQDGVKIRWRLGLDTVGCPR